MMLQKQMSFREFKQVISIESVLSDYGLKKGLKGRGTRLYGPCPLHGGDNPTAFRVDLRRNVWHCYTQCGGGDIIALIRRIENCSYADVNHHLKRIGSLDEPSSNPSILYKQNHTSSDSSHQFQPFRYRQNRFGSQRSILATAEGSLSQDGQGI